MSDATLSARLRTETRALHLQAERSGVMVQLLRGQLPIERYGALVAALYEIYDALEEGLERHAAHLRRIADDDPLALVAHAWLRYLGDLNGGRILERVVRERLGVPDGAMSFYRFPALADPASAAIAWRLSLDRLELDVATVDRLVAEASDGFRRHIAIFEALAGDQDAAEVSSEA